MASLPPRSTNDARQRVENGVLKAWALNVMVNIALVDADGYLVHFVHMDGALLGSADLAVRKAKTSALFRTESGSLGSRSEPGGPLWSIENGDRELVTFAGGVPLFDREGHCIGAIGVSGGTVEQDRQIAYSCTS